MEKEEKRKRLEKERKIKKIMKENNTEIVIIFSLNYFF